MNETEYEATPKATAAVMEPRDMNEGQQTPGATLAIIVAQVPPLGPKTYRARFVQHVLNTTNILIYIYIYIPIYIYIHVI